MKKTVRRCVVKPMRVESRDGPIPKVSASGQVASASGQFRRGVAVRDPPEIMFERELISALPKLISSHRISTHLCPGRPPFVSGARHGGAEWEMCGG